MHLPERVKDSVILTTFAVEARYDDIIQLNHDIYSEALEITKEVYNWSIKQVI